MSGPCTYPTQPSSCLRRSCISSSVFSCMSFTSDDTSCVTATMLALASSTAATTRFCAVGASIPVGSGGMDCAAMAGTCRLVSRLAAAAAALRAEADVDPLGAAPATDTAGPRLLCAALC